MPLSLSDMSQIEEKLGSFSENPTRYRKEFLRLSQAYNLTWSDIYYMLNATLTPDEKDHIWQAAKAHADHLHDQNRDSPVADEVVPQSVPHWTYQPNDPGIKRLNHMITCLLEGMQKNTHIHVNYDKVREITQGADKNPALFLTCLIEAVQKYTNLDITTPTGLLYLHVQLISRSAPNIRRKLRQLEKVPQRDLLEVAFKVFNNRRKLREKKTMREKLNMPFWWQQLREERSPAQVIPDWDLRPAPRPCF